MATHLDPNVRDAWGLPAPRITYDWRRPNEAARVEYMLAKMEEIGRSMGASQVWRAPRGPGAPGAHHEGGTRMGSDPKSSVVNRYGQSWDIPNLFVVGSSTFPTMSGFNPTLTIQALAYMSADAIANATEKILDRFTDMAFGDPQIFSVRHPRKRTPGLVSHQSG
jgi:gluconate 2-dehydrogenase alpha chain